MTTQVQCQALVVAALDGATDALDRVFTPRTWPTAPGVMPILLVTPGKETKRGKGRSVTQFDVIGVVRVQGRVYAKSGAEDAGAVAALAAVQTLQRQIEVAVIAEPNLRRVVQAFASVESQVSIGKEGELTFGEVLVDFGLDYYQGPEDFHPLEGEPLETLAVFADLLNVFSPTGDFTDEPQATPFVADAEPAPRTSGPDGRAEGAFIVDLPQA